MKKLLALCMAFILTFQLVTPVFAEEIEETQAAAEAVEVETEAPVTEIPTTEPPVPETAVPEETSAPTEPQTTTEVTEATASTEETIASTEPTEETTEPTLDLFANDKSIIAAGTCGYNGDNLIWVLSGDGALTISGEGKMMNYSDSSVAPWYSNRTKILSVVVEDGVTSIGSRAFFGCSVLTDVTLSDDMTSIGYDAFRDCGSLNDVIIPESVTEIPYGAFYNCTALKNVTLPKGLLSIENAYTYIWDVYGAFQNCKSLTEVTIPEAVTSIGVAAFRDCDSLVSNRNWHDRSNDSRHDCLRQQQQ